MAIYPILTHFLAHENFNNARKNVQKSSKIFQPSIHNVVNTGTNIENMAFLVPGGLC